MLLFEKSQENQFRAQGQETATRRRKNARALDGERTGKGSAKWIRDQEHGAPVQDESSAIAEKAGRKIIYRALSSSAG